METVAEIRPDIAGAAQPDGQREREFCEWMTQFNSDPEFVKEFTTRFINACNERVLKGGYPTYFGELAQPDGWIAVTERLPEPKTEVLCISAEAKCWILRRFRGRWESRRGIPQYCFITHWQPLPTPPVQAVQEKP